MRTAPHESAPDDPASVPFPGVRRFLNEFGQYAADGELRDILTLARYRDAQSEGAMCAFCGQRYVPDCNSGGCA